MPKQIKNTDYIYIAQNMFARWFVLAVISSIILQLFVIYTGIISGENVANNLQAGLRNDFAAFLFFTFIFFVFLIPILQFFKNGFQDILVDYRERKNLDWQIDSLKAEFEKVFNN